MTSKNRDKKSQGNNKKNKSTSTNESDSQTMSDVSDEMPNLAVKTDDSTNQQGDRKDTMPPTNDETTKIETKKANKTADTSQIPAPVIQKSGSGMATTMATFAFLLSVAAGGGIYMTWQEMQAGKASAASNIASLQEQLKTEMQKTQSSVQSEQSKLNASIAQAQASIKSELDMTANTIRQELRNKASEIASLSKSIEISTNDKIAQAQTNFTNAQAELGAANQNIKETQKRQQSLEVSIDGLYSRIGNTSRDWVIAEADYLLNIANHRLQLEQDVTTSIQALKLADMRINSLQDPALNEVRNVIAQELVALQTLSIPDHAGVAMQLNELENNVDDLPLNARTQLATQVQPTAAAETTELGKWEAVPVAIFEILRSLVKINYNEDPMGPLLTPIQIKNLHENLKLKLEQARLVLLRGDKKLYDANIDIAIDWTKKFFNTDEVATKKFIDTLAYLKTKQVILKTPDISSSLRVLRKVSQRLEMNATNSRTSNNVAMN